MIDIETSYLVEGGRAKQVDEFAYTDRLLVGLCLSKIDLTSLDAISREDRYQKNY